MPFLCYNAFSLLLPLHPKTKMMPLILLFLMLKKANYCILSLKESFANLLLLFAAVHQFGPLSAGPGGLDVTQQQPPPAHKHVLLSPPSLHGFIFSPRHPKTWRPFSTIQAMRHFNCVHALASSEGQHSVLANKHV